MTPILTLTMNPTIDIGLEVESLDPIGKNRATVRDVAVGGGGVNVARAVNELGGEAVALLTAGGDVGRRLRHLLAEEQIEHPTIEIAGETREAVVLFEASTQRSYHIVPPGPQLSQAETEAIIDAVTERAADHDVVVVSGSLPPGVPVDLLARLADALAGSGTRLMLDPSGAELPPSLGEGVHVVKLNRREAGELIGAEVREFDDARRVNRQVLDRRWATIAATTVGELGAMISTDSTDYEIHTPELPGPARSDAGAGDSFIAGLALGLDQGLEVAEAGVLAVAAAAASVLTPGTELCRRADVEQLRPHVRVVRHDAVPSGASRQDSIGLPSHGSGPSEDVER